MPALKTYDQFLSHAGYYSKGYTRFFELINEAPNFKYRNYFVPKHDPVVEPGTTVGKAKLTQLLDNQIKPAYCFLVMAGMYVAHKNWIQKEIEIAQKYGKPVIGLILWGQERTQSLIQEATNEMVGWNTASMIDAIRRHSF